MKARQSLRHRVEIIRTRSMPGCYGKGHRIGAKCRKCDRVEREVEELAFRGLTGNAWGTFALFDPSGTDRQFAAQAADMLFTSSPDLEQTAGIVGTVKDDAAALGRETDVYIQTQIICKPTRREAEEFYHYFAEEHADRDALEYFRRQRGVAPSRGTKPGELPYAKPNRFTMGTNKAYAGLFPGITPLLGSPDDVVGHMQQLNAKGVSGSALVFLNYLDEMPYFVQEVLPRMEKAGLRQPFRRNS